MSHYTYVLSRFNISDCKTFQDVIKKFPDKRPAYLRKLIYLKGYKIVKNGELCPLTQKPPRQEITVSKQNKKRPKDPREALVYIVNESLICFRSWLREKCGLDDEQLDEILEAFDDISQEFINNRWVVIKKGSMTKLKEIVLTLVKKNFPEKIHTINSIEGAVLWKIALNRPVLRWIFRKVFSDSFFYVKALSDEAKKFRHPYCRIYCIPREAIDDFIHTQEEILNLVSKKEEMSLVELYQLFEANDLTDLCVKRLLYLGKIQLCETPSGKVGLEKPSF